VASSQELFRYAVCWVENGGKAGEDLARSA
jgi:hypothetical protein